MDSDDEKQSREKKLNALRDKKNKEAILDENFKKAENKVNKKYGNQQILLKQRSPLYIFTILLIVLAVVGIIITNQIPWMYANYNSPANQNNTIEEFYYRNPNYQDEQDNQGIKELLEYKNGSYILGLSIDDFSQTNRISNLSFILWIIISITLLILTFLLTLLKAPYRWIISLKTIFCTFIAVICLYLIIIYIKFVSSYLLLYHNKPFISQNLPNISISFPTPIIIIIILIFALKISFSIVKLNYKELIRETESSSKEKSRYKYEVKGL